MAKKGAHVKEKKKRKGKGVGIKGGLKCPICDLDLKNYMNYRRHMDGPKHAKMVKLVEAGKFPPVRISKGQASTSGGGGGLLMLLLIGVVVGGLLYYANKNEASV